MALLSFAVKVRHQWLQRHQWWQTIRKKRDEFGCAKENMNNQQKKKWAKSHWNDFSFQNCTWNRFRQKNCQLQIFFCAPNCLLSCSTHNMFYESHMVCSIFSSWKKKLRSHYHFHAHVNFGTLNFPFVVFTHFYIWWSSWLFFFLAVSFRIENFRLNDVPIIIFRSIIMRNYVIEYVL